MQEEENQRGRGRERSSLASHPVQQNDNCRPNARRSQAWRLGRIQNHPALSYQTPPPVRPKPRRQFPDDTLHEEEIPDSGLTERLSSEFVAQLFIAGEPSSRPAASTTTTDDPPRNRKPLLPIAPKRRKTQYPSYRKDLDPGSLPRRPPLDTPRRTETACSKPRPETDVANCFRTTRTNPEHVPSVHRRRRGSTTPGSARL